MKGQKPKFGLAFNILLYRMFLSEGYPYQIVKKIVERYGGKVCVEPILGKGSVLYFTLSVN